MVLLRRMRGPWPLREVEAGGEVLHARHQRRKGRIFSFLRRRYASCGESIEGQKRLFPRLLKYMIELARTCHGHASTYPPLYIDETAHTRDHRLARYQAAGKAAAPEGHRFGLRPLR